MTAPETPNRDAITPVEAPSIGRTADAPPRASWTENAPAGAWCPDEWLGHLDAVAPGLRPPDGQHAPAEATGTRATSAGWTLLLASRRGRLHAHRGEHREDAGIVLTFAGGWSAAVADGAGSATWSRLGSAIATHTAAHALRDALRHGAAPSSELATAMRDAGRAANAAMRRFAELAGLALRDLRTTLLLVVAHAGQVASLQVGDGATAMTDVDGRCILPHAGDSGEFSGEVTHFLPDDGALARLEASYVARSLDGLTAIIAASDGVEDPWYPFARHAPALIAQIRDGVSDDTASAAGVTQPLRGPVLHATDPVHALITWLEFEKRGENDDRTLFFAWASSASA